LIAFPRNASDAQDLPERTEKEKKKKRKEKKRRKRKRKATDEEGECPCEPFFNWSSARRRRGQRLAVRNGATGGSSRRRTASRTAHSPTLASAGRIAGPVGVMQQISRCKAGPSQRGRCGRRHVPGDPLAAWPEARPCGAHGWYRTDTTVMADTAGTAPRRAPQACTTACTPRRAPRVGAICTRSAPGLHQVCAKSAPSLHHVRTRRLPAATKLYTKQSNRAHVSALSVNARSNGSRLAGAGLAALTVMTGLRAAL
jgi:hypothetical protein